MKFKRGVNLVLKGNQDVIMPRGESWRYSVFSGDRDDDSGILANSNVSGKGMYTQMYSAVGIKLKFATSICIIGTASAAD